MADQPTLASILKSPPPPPATVTPPPPTVTTPHPTTTAQEDQPIHALIVDAGPLISSTSTASLLSRARAVYTTPAVIAEVRDPAARSRLETTWLPFLRQRAPAPESVRVVADFARRTGDYAALSVTDMQLLALTYELECEGNGGDWRLRRTPGQRGINGPVPGKKGKKQLVEVEEEGGVKLEAPPEEEEKTEQAPAQTEEDKPEDKAESNAPAKAPAEAKGPKEKRPRQRNRKPNAEAAKEPNAEKDGQEQEGPKEKNARARNRKPHKVEPEAAEKKEEAGEPKEKRSGAKGRKPKKAAVTEGEPGAAGEKTGNQEEPKKKKRKCGPRKKKAATEGEAPKTAIEGEPKTAIEGEPKTAAEGEPKTAAEGEPKTATEGEPKTATEGEPKTATEGEPKTATEGEPKTAIESKPKTTTEEREPKAAAKETKKPADGKKVAAPARRRRTHFARQTRWGKKDAPADDAQKDAGAEEAPVEGKEAPEEEAPKVETKEETEAGAAAPQPEIKEAPQEAPPAAAAAAPDQPTSDATSGDDDSDDEGWITATNLRTHQHQDAHPATTNTTSKKLWPMAAALATTDYAMQNVLLQMNLHLVSPGDLQRIRSIKTWILRCHACFKLCRDTSRQFCPTCGGATLLRASCSTDSKGAFHVHLKRNMQWSTRGAVYSIPKTRQGSASGKGVRRNLILREDQVEYQRELKHKQRQKERDLLDPDYLPGILTGERRDMVGAMPKIGYGRRNPNERQGGRNKH